MAQFSMEIMRLTGSVLRGNQHLLADEDYQRFEKSMDRTFDVVERPFEGEFRPEGEWHPSNELFAALGIHPVVYAAKKKSAKATREEADAGGRPQLGTMPLQHGQEQEAHAHEPNEPVDDETTVVRRITTNIFEN